MATKERRGRSKWIRLSIIGLILLILLFLTWMTISYVSNILPRSDWDTFRREYLHASGRIIDTGNEGVSHSEGQAYGMLFAEAYGDREAFDRIWNWTKKNLQTRPEDKLLSWLWKQGGEGVKEGIADTNNASDGDLIAAWALLRASEHWKDYAYKKAGVEIFQDLKRLNVIETNGYKVLLPGTFGFADKPGGVVLNPSYYVFPALEVAQRLMPKAGWDTVIKDGVKIIALSRFGNYQLCADWIQLYNEGDDASKAGIIPAPDFPPYFGYNAVRIPLNIAWANNSPKVLEPFAKFWQSQHRPFPATINLATDAYGPDPALPGMDAIATLTIARFNNARLSVSDISEIKPGESYYSASLKLLTKIAIRDTLK